MDEVTKILGLPGKPEGVDGSRVEEMVLAGQIEEVARDFLQKWPVSKRVNSSRADADDSTLIEKVEVAVA